jgi:hypothetical protein
MIGGEAGRSAAREAQETEFLVRDLESELRRAYARQSGFAAAAAAEPLTAAALHPLQDQGWQVLHDRRWPGSTRANVDHIVIGPPGVAIIDTKNWAGSIEVRADRLWCGDDDRHESVDDLLRLVTAVEELLVEVECEPTAHRLGLSAIHVLPVLAFTRFTISRRRNPRIGRVRLTAVRELPALLASQPTVLASEEVVALAEHLAREMPSAGDDLWIPRPRAAAVGVPIRPEPLPVEPVSELPADADALFDVADLAEQLAAAATRPLVEWMGFLHPAQARLVRRRFAGPARVRGPAGTGKSVVMLHRAAWLAETQSGRVLVTSFVRTLPHHQSAVYRHLSPQTADRVDFLGLHEVARRLLTKGGSPMHVNQRRIDAAFNTAWSRVGAKSILGGIAPSRYWRQEIDFVIKGRGLRQFVEYEALDRRGRSIALPSREKVAVWELLTAYSQQLEQRGTHDHNDVLSAALHLVNHCRRNPGWAAVLVDEVQDLPMIGLRLCASLGGTGPNGLFLVGDGQQAIYPGGFTLPEAGVTVIGRAVVLRVNYRNTRQILDSARHLVENHEFSDLDTTTEAGCREVEVLRDGPAPTQQTAPDRWRLALQLARALQRDADRGVDWGEMAVLTLTHAEASYLREQLAARDIPIRDLRSWNGQPDHQVKIDTVHRAKGLDFAAVYLPSLRSSSEASTTQAIVEHETLKLRQQFVGRTRARDRLWVGNVVRPVGRGPRAKG